MAETTTIKITGPGSDKFGEQPAVKLHTGALMPMFGLGTWKSDPKDVRDAVVAAVRAGYRHIDLAAAYGNQQAVGEGLKTLFENGEVKREDLFITSKLWLSHCWPEHYKEMLNQTLSDLGLSYLDMYLVSSPRRQVRIACVQTDVFIPNFFRFTSPTSLRRTRACHRKRLIVWDTLGKTTVPSGKNWKKKSTRVVCSTSVPAT
eukprot:gb/GECG01008266.1/.p1 GENE.gb/GECG01008266.1/~~gb/GECG01008266.1/.p1  ORF type:complete len:203 (+),score=14.79 gb/GECG01008266.1/:1-609(+)